MISTMLRWDSNALTLCRARKTNGSLLGVCIYNPYRTSGMFSLQWRQIDYTDAKWRQYDQTEGPIALIDVTNVDKMLARRLFLAYFFVATNLKEARIWEISIQFERTEMAPFPPTFHASTAVQCPGSWPASQIVCVRLRKDKLVWIAKHQDNRRSNLYIAARRMVGHLACCGMQRDLVL